MNILIPLPGTILWKTLYEEREFVYPRGDQVG